MTPFDDFSNRMRVGPPPPPGRAGEPTDGRSVLTTTGVCGKLMGEGRRLTGVSDGGGGVGVVGRVTILVGEGEGEGEVLLLGPAATRIGCPPTAAAACLLAASWNKKCRVSTLERTDYWTIF